MAKKYIIDASALLATLYQENTNINLEEYLENSVMNTVNASEVLAVLQNKGMPRNIAEEVLSSTISEIIPIHFNDSCLAAELKVQNKEFGISTGDSFCLASGIHLNYPIITADKIWAKLNINAEIILIR